MIYVIELVTLQAGCTFQRIRSYAAGCASGSLTKSSSVDFAKASLDHLKSYWSLVPSHDMGVACDYCFSTLKSYWSLVLIYDPIRFRNDSFQYSKKLLVTLNEIGNLRFA